MTSTSLPAGFTRDALTALTSGDVAVPAAMQRLRAHAFDLFEAMPMPSPDTEEWRYTDLRDLDLSAYRPYQPEPTADTLDDVKPEILAAAGTVGERHGLSIQHNSTVVTTHLHPDVEARGVVFGSLDAALDTHADLLKDRLHVAVPPARTRFTALHAALRTGGTFVHVPKNVNVELPLQTLTYVDADGLAAFPHTVIVLEEGASLTFIDRYVSPGPTRVLSDAVVEIYAGPDSSLRYVSLQEWGDGVMHVGVQRAIVGRDADVRTLAVTFGAGLSRAEAETILEGDGGSSEMLGVYFGDGSQHFDHRSIQDHVGSQTSSDLLYKGALRGRSRAIYSGNVIIRQGAHKCDAYQTNRNILLSEEAKADSIPNLEILSNDPVRCGHAASVGPVDEDTLFYIQSRGIDAREAQRLIVFGFFQEVLDRVTLPEVRAGLEAAIESELELEEA